MNTKLRLRINFFEEPSNPTALPAPIAYPSGEFDTLDNAHKTAFADADKFKAHSIVIESIEGGAIFERWIRAGDSWRRKDE